MRNVALILRRELASYFATPLAYVFIFSFMVSAGIRNRYNHGWNRKNGRRSAWPRW